MSYKEVYEELSLLGEGGMGKVYLVRHRRLGVLRAMKVVRKDDATKLPAEVDILKTLITSGCRGCTTYMRTTKIYRSFRTMSRA